MNTVDISLVDWSRAQFALTAMYHWLFVPLTLGLSFIVAIMETMWIKSGDERLKKMTRFWMTLFGINFAIGVATGIILEFEFGTNWSNYSWIVGDIFGAPLAIEGIMAFFLESTFIAVMFFGWGRVSKKFHLVSTWLVAIGSNLSAFWILVANAWMQHPVGTYFNPETARSEMIDFWAVAFSPVALNKFAHTITSGYVTASLFVVGVSAWYLLKKRNQEFASKSIKIAAIFGLSASILLAYTGDGSAYHVAQKQPMKLAAMEGLYDGKHDAELVVIGILNPAKTIHNNENPFLMHLSMPSLLSVLANREAGSFVPGMSDIINGNTVQKIPSAQQRIDNGKTAVQALADYKVAQKSFNVEEADKNNAVLQKNFKDFGYGFIKQPDDLIPNIPMIFYSFHLMVGLGFYFIVLFFGILMLQKYNKLEQKWVLYTCLWSIPLGYLASQLGWIVAEVGRQPWAIQDLLPTGMSTSSLNTGAVQTTFFLFFALFTALLIAEIKIMLSQIKKGPDESE